jgi:hypothetical protein
MAKSGKAAGEAAQGACLCGAVRLEIDVPAFWAWHDHGRASRLAQGCAYATYVGTRKSRFRITEGEDEIARYEEPESRAVRSFCRRCGTPVSYERPHAPTWVNVPRALFSGRTGREPRYHLHFDEAPEWAFDGGPLKPLKGYPGVMWQRPRRKPPVI